MWQCIKSVWKWLKIDSSWIDLLQSKFLNNNTAKFINAGIKLCQITKNQKRNQQDRISKEYSL